MVSLLNQVELMGSNIHGEINVFLLLNASSIMIVLPPKLVFGLIRSLELIRFRRKLAG